jgi:hypothetical protein
MSFSSYLLEVGSLNLLNLSNVKTTRIIFFNKISYEYLQTQKSLMCTTKRKELS